MALCVFAGLGALGAVALNGNARLRATSHHLHVVGEQAALDNATWAYLMDFKGGLESYIGASDPAIRLEIGDLVEQRVALIDGRLAEMRRRYPEGSDGWRLTNAQELPYRELRRIWRRWSARPTGPARGERAKARALAAIRTHGLLMADSGEASSRGDERVSEEAEALAARQHRETRETVVAALMALLAAGGVLVLWSWRSVVPAIERERAERQAAFDQSQLHESLLTAVDDRAAGAVLALHVEHQVPGASIVVLDAVRAKDALEARVPAEPDAALVARLEGARPRDCLALRQGAVQETKAGDRLSMSGCGVCGKLPGATSCHPLVPGDPASGAVLVTLDRPITEGERRRVRESVGQAAPVITRLRDLADAQARAATDSLTGMPNRRTFHETLRRMAAQTSRTCEPLAVVLLDVDHFKAVNDTYGHAAGDLVLRFLGACLKSSVRAGDFVARLGGEEFALLLPATGRDGALVLAENVRRAVAALDVPGVDRAITASLGVAVIPDDAGDADGVVHRADDALYAAKAAGRDRVMAAGDGAAVGAHK